MTGPVFSLGTLPDDAKGRAEDLPLPGTGRQIVVRWEE